MFSLIDFKMRYAHHNLKFHWPLVGTPGIEEAGIRGVRDRISYIAGGRFSCRYIIRKIHQYACVQSGRQGERQIYIVAAVVGGS